ncbi:tRNA pseudouridine synthase 1 [Gonapodya sp. JEL0774]|nr:tRNA pseudouridine synthase 1 [Gonapodya sp. JEL0774]
MDAKKRIREDGSAAIAENGQRSPKRKRAEQDDSITLADAVPHGTTAQKTIFHHISTDTAPDSNSGAFSQDQNAVENARAPSNTDSSPSPSKASNRERGNRSGRGTDRGARGRGRGGGRSGGKQPSDKERAYKRPSTSDWAPRDKSKSVENADDDEEKEDGPRGTKRKVVLLMGYSGSGYQGMQVNPNARTIEGELWKALVDTECVSKLNADDPRKVAFMRAARTDKGVHALGQVVSLKMVFTGNRAAANEQSTSTRLDDFGAVGPQSHQPDIGSSVDVEQDAQPASPSVHADTVAAPKATTLPPTTSKADKEALIAQERELATETIAAINANLPEQIRVWGVRHVLRSFNAKNSCDSRIYEYIMPTYLLMEPHPGYYPDSVAALEHLSKASSTVDTVEHPSAHPFPDPSTLGFSLYNDNREGRFRMYEVPKSTPEQLEAKRTWRVPAESVARLREVLSGYVGTRNFHNFTIGKKYEERNSKRHIISFECSDPYIRDGVEWLGLKVWGNSFMLHQIRKMVGLAVLMVRTKTPLSLLTRSFSPVKLNIPKAPASGLFLNQVVYTSYNERAQNTPLQPNQTIAERSRITFDEFADEIAQFKEKWVIGDLVKDEKENNTYDEWLRIVDAHSTEYQYFLRSDGTVQEEDKPPYFATTKELNSFDKPGGERVEEGEEEDGAQNGDE